MNRLSKLSMALIFAVMFSLVAVGQGMPAKNTDSIELDVEKSSIFDRFTGNLFSITLQQDTVNRGDTVEGSIYGNIGAVRSDPVSRTCNGEDVKIDVNWYDPRGQYVAGDYIYDVKECQSYRIDYSFDVWEDAEFGEWSVKVQYHAEGYSDYSEWYDFGSDTYEVSRTYEDSDGDGVIDINDECPGTASGVTVNDRGCPVDSDGDGVKDSSDQYPNNPSCTKDSDGDGTCDGEDAFPSDPTKSSDSDGDGLCDSKDSFPNDPSKQYDQDGDGVADSNDAYPSDPKCSKDSDGDGLCDSKDKFPNDPTKKYDQDGDGVAGSNDNCPWQSGSREFNGCPDGDGDGVPDPQDSCPQQGDQGFGLKNNGCPIQDTDNDNVGDNYDQCPGTPPQANVDSKGCALDGDNDGVPNYQDDCPGTSNPKLSVDNKGCAIQDADGDGVVDSQDQAPNTYGSKTDGTPTLLDTIINTLGLRGLL